MGYIVPGNRDRIKVYNLQSLQCLYMLLLIYTQFRFCGLCKRRPVSAHWTAQSEFSELRVEKNMLRDHTIDHMYEIAVRLQKQEKLHNI